MSVVAVVLTAIAVLLAGRPRSRLAASAGGARWRVPRGGRRRRGRRQRESTAYAVCQFCEALAAELVAGAPVRQALERAAEELAPAEVVAAAARLGADVPQALRALARTPGAGDLRVVAAAWQVAQRSGGGLAEPLQRAAATLRERRRTAQLVTAELAPARATARMMAALPVVFLLAGSGLGGHPLAFLTTTVPGVLCLVLGLTLAAIGLRWLELIAGSVEREPS